MALDGRATALEVEAAAALNGRAGPQLVCVSLERQAESVPTGNQHRRRSASVGICNRVRNGFDYLCVSFARVKQP